MHLLPQFLNDDPEGFIHRIMKNGGLMLIEFIQDASPFSQVAEHVMVHG